MTALGNSYIVKTTDGDIDMRVIKIDNGIYTLERMDGELGYIELDWMEFMDQSGLGRITQIFPSPGSIYPA